MYEKNYEELGMAILTQACEDYVEYADANENFASISLRQSAERYIRTNSFLRHVDLDIDGSEILKELDKQIVKKHKRRNYGEKTNSKRRCCSRRQHFVDRLCE